MDPKTVSTKEKQNAVKEAFVFAWEGYKKFSWGYDENRPVSNNHNNPRNGWGATIVDALDTLYIMGLQEDFSLATDFVSRIDWKHPPTSSLVQVFETVIRYVGGLLSAYDLSQNPVFVERARDLTDRLLPAFNSTTGIPYQYIDITSGEPRRGGASVLAEVGTVQLEFNRLSDITGDPKYRQAGQKVIDYFDTKVSGQHPKGLYPIFIDPESGNFQSGYITWGGMGDSFYEYLVKVYVYSGKRDEQKMRMFIDSIRSTQEHMVVSPKNHTSRRLLADLDGKTKKHVMGELACFVPGAFLLAAQTMPELYDIVPLASDVLDSCVLAWTSTKTGIAPEVFGWADPETGEFPVPKSERNQELAEQFGVFPVGDGYILRPETLESIFYFYRHTKDEKYRDLGWELFRSIQLHCRANSGYSGIRHVDSISPEWDDRQERLLAIYKPQLIYPQD
ncbi:hypothetical protein Unana1_01051 [Umbelopsis nana]